MSAMGFVLMSGRVGKQDSAQSLPIDNAGSVVDRGTLRRGRVQPGLAAIRLMPGPPWPSSTTRSHHGGTIRRDAQGWPSLHPGAPGGRGGYHTACGTISPPMCPLTARAEPGRRADMRAQRTILIDSDRATSLCEAIIALWRSGPAERRGERPRQPRSSLEQREGSGRRQRRARPTPARSGRSWPLKRPGHDRLWGGRRCRGVDPNRRRSHLSSRTPAARARSLLLAAVDDSYRHPLPRRVRRLQDDGHNFAASRATASTTAVHCDGCGATGARGLKDPSTESSGQKSLERIPTRWRLE